MSIPVAMIPYTNMAPYRQLPPPSGCHFVSLVPRKSIDALRSKAVVAAAVPVGGLAALGDTVETVGRFGIAAKGPCMSVLLFSRLPFDDLHAPRTLQVTRETASSVRLLYLLMGHTVGFDRLPYLSHAGQDADGKLMIGDQALVRGQTLKAGDPYSHITDLSELWTTFNGVPFVFARWVVRKDAPLAIKAAIKDWLDTFKAKESMLVEMAAAPCALDLGLSEDVVRRYFSVIRRCLNTEDLKGQQLFIEQIEKFGRRTLFEPQQ